MKAALSALLVCAAIATAHAQEVVVEPPANDAQAKAHAQGLLSEGTAAYGRGDYATALDKFTAAYEIFPSPKLWFNIGQANRDLGRPVEAVAAFDRFLRNAGDAPPETLAEARRSAAELKTKLGADPGDLRDRRRRDHRRREAGRQHAARRDGVDHAGPPPGRGPARRILARDRGRRRRRRPGRPRRASSCARSICARRTRAKMARWSGTARRPRRTSPIYRRTWFWVATGVVIGAGIAAGVLIATRSSGGLDTTLGSQRAF